MAMVINNELIQLEPIPKLEGPTEEPGELDETEEELETENSELQPQTEEQKPETVKKELSGYLVFQDAPQVKNLFKLLHVLCDEITFKLTRQGLTTKLMDPLRVAMIEIIIPRDYLTEHLCTEDTKFCFDVERFLDKTLKNVGKDEMLRLDVQTGKLDKMTTQINGRFKRQFSMSLLECSEEEIPNPQITFNYSARLLLENLNQMFKDLTEHVQILGERDSLTFTEAGDIETFKTTFQKGDETILNIESREESKAEYPVSYLKELLKALAPLTDIIELNLSTNMPIKISADMNRLGTVNIYVAPGIEEE